MRQHFLRHREDKIALRVYLDRLGDRPRTVITTVDDPDFDAKIQATVLKQMQAADNNSQPARQQSLLAPYSCLNKRDRPNNRSLKSSSAKFLTKA